MTELALTRIFSVTMYYHFAFLAISIALFGLSASGVFVYVMRARLASISTRALLTSAALLHALVTIVALACLVRIRVGLNYSPSNLALMLAIYLLAALPFFAGGAVISVAFARLVGSDQSGVQRRPRRCGGRLPRADSTARLAWRARRRVNRRRSRARRRGLFCSEHQPRATSRGPWWGCSLCPRPRRPQVLRRSTSPIQKATRATASCSTSGIRFRAWPCTTAQHGDWSLSPRFKGIRGDSLFMDIDSAASTPILKGTGNPADATYLRYELTALAYHLVERPAGFTALVIGPGGGRDLLSALVFGSRHVDAVEINPIIARDVMLDRFRDYSGGVYTHPRVAVHVDDGRSFIRRSASRYDVIQASLVDTWAATAAGAYTLTENSLYTTEAFGEYIDHLTDDGLLVDYALGVRRTPSRLAGAGGVCGARTRRGAAPGDRAQRPRRDVPAEAAAVYGG